jgi:hypothetical protein
MTPQPSPYMHALTGVLIVAFIAFWSVPWWRIFRRLGYAPALAFLMWIPVINAAVLYYVAFTRSPRSPSISTEMR